MYIINNNKYFYIHNLNKVFKYINVPQISETNKIERIIKVRTKLSNVSCADETFIPVFLVLIT